MRRASLVYFFWLTFAFLPAFAYQLPDFSDYPISGNQAESLLRTWEEKNLLVTDPLLLQYIEALAQRLTNSAQLQRLRTSRLVIVNDPAINAFATKGPVIGLNRGLLLAVDYEAELAAVLAHEMAHVQLEHLDQLQTSSRSQAPLLIVALVAAALLANHAEASQAALASGFAGLAQQQVGQIRRFESEADTIGLRILTSANFPAAGMASFFEKMQKMQQENPNLAYLRTHPLSSERLANITNRLKNYPIDRALQNSLDFSLFQARLCAKSEQNTCPRLKDPLAQDYFKALQYLEQKNYPQAQAIFRGLLQSQMLPHLWWYLGYGQSLLASGDSNGAFKQYARAYELYPNNQQALFSYIAALLENKRLTEAQALLERNKLRFDQNADYYFLQARLYQKLGKNMQLHESLGDFYYLLGIEQEAGLHWQQAQAAATFAIDIDRLSAKLSQLKQALRQ